MTTVAPTKVHLIFIPDEVSYEALASDSVRRAEIVLEMMKELRLEVDGAPGQGTDFGEHDIETREGRLWEPSIEDVVTPLLLEYSGRWKTWMVEHNEADPDSLGTLGLASAGLQRGVYYYYGPEGEWCNRGLQVERVLPSGTVVPFELSRPVKPNEPEGQTLTAKVKVTLTHPPVQP